MLPVSHHFGFGLLDAGAMVELAMEWQTVPRQRHCTVSADFTDRSVLLSDDADSSDVPRTSDYTSFTVMPHLSSSVARQIGC